MLSFFRRELKTIIVAMVTAALTASAPAIAHGVNHALFAHNADKVDGKDAADFLARDKTATASVRADGTLISSNREGTESDQLGEGFYEVRFRRSAVDLGDKCRPVASPIYALDAVGASVDGGGRTFSVVTWDDEGQATDSPFTVTTVC